MSCWSDKLCITPPAAKNSNALKKLWFNVWNNATL